MNAALIHAAINLMQDPKNLEEQCSTKCEAVYTPVVTTSNDTPAAANNTQRTPTVAAHAWHYTAMSAATFTLSALLAYIATEAICKCVRGRNTPTPNTPTSAKHLHV